MTQTKLDKTSEDKSLIDLSELFVIKDTSYKIPGYWTSGGYYSSNINDAKQYKTEIQAQMIANTLLATKPTVVKIKILEQ